MIQRVTLSIPVKDTTEAKENGKIITEMLNEQKMQYVYSHLVLTDEQFMRLNDE